MITVTIANQVVSVYKDSLSGIDKINEQTDFSLTVIDLTGALSFFKNQPIEIVDDTRGTRFSGYINNQPTAVVLYPNPGRTWALSCRDQTWLANKRTSNKTYKQQYAGTILVDQIQREGAQEGLFVAAALRWEELQSEWAQGTLANTVATTNAGSGNVGDGDLELALAGSSLTITEQTTADFAAGTLTGVQAINDTLIPTNLSALKFQATLNSQVTSGLLYIRIWTGSYVIQSSDSVTYDVWVSGTSPSELTGFDFVCSDGTTLRDSGLMDQNGLSCHPHQDISGFASGAWYSRTISLTGSALVGKTISYASVAFDKDVQAGTYTAYFRHIVVGSTTILSTAATATPLNPPAITKNTGWSAITCAIAQTYDTTAAYRVSAAYALSSVGVVRSSYLAWMQSAPTGTGVTLSYSIDGGASYLACANQAALPAMLPGQSVSGTSILLKETFTNTSGDPTVYATLQAVAADFQPAYEATLPAPVSYAATTQAGWNAGTLSNTLANAGGDLSLNQVTRYFANGSIAGQTLYGTSNAAQALSGQQFTITTGFTGTGGEVRSRLDFLGQWQNFKLEFDVYVDSASIKYGCVYRTTGWQNADSSWAYAVEISNTTIELRLGSNSSGGSPSSSSLQLVTFTQTLTLNTWYRFKVDVSGNTHQVYIDNILYINTTDSTWTAAGYIGLRNRNPTTAQYTAKFSDVGVCAALSGTWISPATSLNSLITAGQSVITWDESLTKNPDSVMNTVQVSLDGGSTYQDCTNGAAIPGLTPGTNVVGKSLITKVTLSASTAVAAPDVQQLVWRVIANYSAAGTRSTAPIGWDSMQRGNVVGGFGPATNGGTYSKTGTGTVALTGDEATISATTGDVHMVLSGTSGADEEATVRFTLSVSGEIGGMELRYVDANNYYRLAATTTTLSIVKASAGIQVTLKTLAQTLATGVVYHLHFRVVGSGPASLYGRLWLDGTTEPSTWDLTASD